MGPRLNSFSPVDRNSITAGSWRRLDPAQIKDKRPHIPHSRSQGDLSDYTCRERLLGGQKGEGVPPVVGDANLPIGLFPRILPG